MTRLPETTPVSVPHARDALTNAADALRLRGVPHYVRALTRIAHKAELSEHDRLMLQGIADWLDGQVTVAERAGRLEWERIKDTGPAWRDHNSLLHARRACGRAVHGHGGTARDSPDLVGSRPRALAALESRLRTRDERARRGRPCCAPARASLWFMPASVLV